MRGTIPLLYTVLIIRGVTRKSSRKPYCRLQLMCPSPPHVWSYNCTGPSRRGSKATGLGKTRFYWYFGPFPMYFPGKWCPRNGQRPRNSQRIRNSQCLRTGTLYNRPAAKQVAYLYIYYIYYIIYAYTAQAGGRPGEGGRCSPRPAPPLGVAQCEQAGGGRRPTATVACSTSQHHVVYFVRRCCRRKGGMVDCEA